MRKDNRNTLTGRNYQKDFRCRSYMNYLDFSIKELNRNGYTFYATDGNRSFSSTERGVKPLLDLIDSAVSLSGCSAADKVVGRAAAFLYVRLKVSELHASIMSEPALEVFQQYGIPVSYDQLVKVIFNRTLTGLCPMESSVLGITDAEEAEAAIRRKLASLREQAE